MAKKDLIRKKEQKIIEENGIIYHRSGITGDYDGFDRVEDLLRFIETGEKEGSVCPL